MRIKQWELHGIDIFFYISFNRITGNTYFQCENNEHNSLIKTLQMGRARSFLVIHIIPKEMVVVVVVVVVVIVVVVVVFLRRPGRRRWRTRTSRWVARRA